MDKPFGFVRMNHGFDSGLFQLGDRPAGWPDAQAVYTISKDAYDGAMEEVRIWKKRALEAEELNRRFISDVNGRSFMGEPALACTDVAGIDSVIGHLSALVDEQHRLLIDVVEVCGRDAYGAEFEDGESDLIDRVRSHLSMLAPLPIKALSEKMNTDS